MSKKNNTVLGIFMESIGLYFSNFYKFVKYMTFPVLGQIFGLLLVFLLTFFYAKNMPLLIEKFPTLDNYLIIVSTLLILTLPGLIIFMKAFWEYLIAYGAINSMFENMTKSGKVYDYDAHTELIKRRSVAFVGLWLLFGLFSLLYIVPLIFWIPCGILTIYFVLVFQVFTFETELSPIGCVKRSFELIKGHFAQTFVLFALIGALTYILIPEISKVVLEFLKITQSTSNLILPIVSSLPINELNNLLSYLYIPAISNESIATFIVTTFVTQIFIQYTLPMRSILWSMWYKKLNNGNLGFNDNTKKKKYTKKKPSEKLMEASHKKYSSKKLDRNILKRAMEKDE